MISLEMGHKIYIRNLKIYKLFKKEKWYSKVGMLTVKWMVETNTFQTNLGDIRQPNKKEYFYKGDRIWAWSWKAGKIQNFKSGETI